MSDRVLNQWPHRVDIVNFSTIGLCIISASLVGSKSSIAAAVESGKPTELHSVSIDAVLERKVRSVRNVRWHNSGHLIGEFAEPDSGQTVTRLISMNGSLGTPLVTAQLASTSPDGRTILQQTDDGWMIRDLSGRKDRLIGEPEEEARDFSAFLQPVWSPDGRFVVIIEHEWATQRKNTQEATVTEGVPVIDVGNQVPISEQWVTRITIVDHADTAAVGRILVDEMALYPRWAPDNTLFVSHVRHFQETATEILRIKPGDQPADEIYRSAGRFQSMVPAVHPDGKLIALVLDIDNRAWSDFQSILLIDAETGEELRRLTHDLPILGGDYTWSINGEEIYARVRNGGLDQIYAIPLDGEPRPLTSGARRHFNIDLSPDGARLSYQTEDGYGRRDIRVLDLEMSEEKVVLVIDEPAKEFALGEWKHVRWRSTDGVKPFGYLITPPDFDPDRKYPMIVSVHGVGEGSRLYLDAPLTLTVAPGPLQFHAWAALGYVVLVPDYRSTGDYGPNVIAERYKAGEIAAVKDIEDIVSGTRFVIDQGSVDPTRVAIFGHSAGGQRVYVLLNQYDLYAAAILNEAISPDPVSSFIQFASGKYTGSYPSENYRQQYGGELAEFPERYKQNFMFDSYRNKTPTLIMVGNETLGGMDHMPNEVLYSILKKHGVPTRMLKFVGEGHNYSRPESTKLAFEEVRRWLEMHMPAEAGESLR